LPAVLGACAFRPGEAVTLLEIALPDCHSQNLQVEAQ
jgi:hypothetical protein